MITIGELSDRLCRRATQALIPLGEKTSYGWMLWLPWNYLTERRLQKIQESAMSCAHKAKSKQLQLFAPMSPVDKPPVLEEVENEFNEILSVLHDLRNALDEETARDPA